MKLMVVALAGLSLGCTAQMVAAKGRSPYGPTGERPGGQIRYLNAGASSVVEARREDAYRQMYDHCDGRYRITKEWDETDGYVTNVWTNTNQNAQASAYGSAYSVNAYGSAQTNSMGSAWTSSVVYRNIEFECDPSPGTGERVARVSAPQDAPPTQVADADTLFRRSKAMFAVDRLGEAKSAAKDCLQQAPTHFGCHYIRFRIAERENDRPNMVIACKNFLKFAPQSVPAEYIDACATIVTTADSDSQQMALPAAP